MGRMPWSNIEQILSKINWVSIFWSPLCTNQTHFKQLKSEKWTKNVRECWRGYPYDDWPLWTKKTPCTWSVEPVYLQCVFIHFDVYCELDEKHSKWMEWCLLFWWSWWNFELEKWKLYHIECKTFVCLLKMEICCTTDWGRHHHR